GDGVKEPLLDVGQVTPRTVVPSGGGGGGGGPPPPPPPPPPGNTAPTASVTTVCLGSDLCGFSGAGSSDPDSGDSVVSWSWAFGDGTTGSGVSVTHVYAVRSAVYTVRLTVADTHGATGTTTTTVTCTTSGRGKNKTVTCL